MALIDPPQYVGIDPDLIYSVQDLQRQNYQRLLQIIGWMWVTRKSGSALGTSVAELAQRWAVAERTVYHTLQVLTEHGYLTVSHSRGRVYLQRGPAITHNTPGEPVHNMQSESATQHAGRAGTQHAGRAGTQQAARGGSDNTPGEPAEATGHKPRATNLHETRAGEEIRAMNLHETGPKRQNRAMNLHEPNTNSPVVVVGSASSESQLQLQQTINAAVQTACIAAGIFDDKAAELAADPWITEERIKRWHDDLLRQQRAGIHIGSLAALLWSNLKHHREPPPSAEDRERQQRLAFIGGEYGDYVES